MATSMISLSLSQQLINDLSKKLGENTCDLSSEKIGGLVTKALKLSLEKKLQPGLIKSSYRDAEAYRPYYVSKSIELKLKKTLKEHILIDPTANLSSLTMKLLCAVASQKHQASPGINTSDNFESWFKSCGMDHRSEQVRMIKEVSRGFSVKNQPIVFSEASVGVGKTLAMSVTALKRAQELIRQNCEEAVVVAAPTYQIAMQLESALSMLNNKNDLNISIKLVRSRSEYVSSELISNFINNQKNPPHFTANILNLIENKIHLRHEYETAGLDCKNMTLSRHTDPDDAAELEYQSERSSNLDAKIIVCTHAFLACHVSTLRRRIHRYLPSISGETYYEFNKLCFDALHENMALITENRMLPKINLLIVDEAHALHDSYSSLQECRIPLSSVKRTITKVLGNKATPDKLEFINEFITAATARMNKNKSYPASITKILNKGIKALMPLVKVKKNTPEKMMFLEFADQIQEMSNNARDQHELYISPIQSKYSISVSKGKPESWLNFTWMLADSALCVSGTLATGNGIDCYYPMASKLCIDHQRVVSIQPIETTWLRKNVTLHAPPVSKNKNGLPNFANTAFLPPGNKNELQKWVSDQADIIGKLLENSSGGVMIVCTSYDQIDSLYSQINIMESIQNQPVHLFKSKRTQSLVSQVAEFKKSYLAGLRPIWIAISSAGTGVDITDKQAKPIDDQMLSHLVVTRLPFSPANKNSNYMKTIEDGLVDFKQILGRLVRRPDRKNMHLHVLDARARVEVGAYRRFKFILDKYDVINTLEEIN